MSEISKTTDERELGHGNQPFTNEQVDELEARAEVRDQRRPRKSRFSTTEQGELDETADTLRAEGVVTADALRAEVTATAKSLREERLETARSLDFNAIQKADLTHRFNQVEEKGLIQSTKRLWMFLLITLLVVIIAFGAAVLIHQQSQINANRATIATLCHHHTVSCTT
jgi:hypothetical protein